VIRFALLSLAVGLFARAAASQEGAGIPPLQEALRDFDPEGPWHYNDLAAGLAAAKASGKPVLVVFR